MLHSVNIAKSFAHPRSKGTKIEPLTDIWSAPGPQTQVIKMIFYEYKLIHDT